MFKDIHCVKPEHFVPDLYICYFSKQRLIIKVIMTNSDYHWKIIICQSGMYWPKNKGISFYMNHNQTIFSYEFYPMLDLTGISSPFKYIFMMSFSISIAEHMWVHFWLSLDFFLRKSLLVNNWILSFLSTIKGIKFSYESRNHLIYTKISCI